jgi:hypothetical protein
VAHRLEQLFAGVASRGKQPLKEIVDLGGDLPGLRVKQTS